MHYTLNLNKITEKLEKSKEIAFIKSHILPEIAFVCE